MPGVLLVPRVHAAAGAPSGPPGCVRTPRVLPLCLRFAAGAGFPGASTLYHGKSRLETRKPDAERRDRIAWAKTFSLFMRSPAGSGPGGSTTAALPSAGPHFLSWSPTQDPPEVADCDGLKGLGSPRPEGRVCSTLLGIIPDRGYGVGYICARSFSVLANYCSIFAFFQ